MTKITEVTYEVLLVQHPEGKRHANSLYRLSAFPFLLTREGAIKLIASVIDKRQTERKSDGDPHAGTQAAQHIQRNKISHSLESTQTEKQTNSKENRKTQNGPAPNCSEGFYSDGLNWKAAKAGNSTSLIHRSENKS